MKILLFLFAILVMVGVISGCSSHTTTGTVAITAPTTSLYSHVDSSVILALHKDTAFNAYTDAQLLNLAHAACADLVQGYSLTQTVYDGVSTGLPASDTGYLIGVAMGAYCPQFEYLITGPTN